MTLQPAQPKTGRRSYTYEEWYSMYYDEINQLVSDLVDTIMNGFCRQPNLKNETFEETTHSLNIVVFSDMVKHRLYETSDNRFKDTDGIWQS